MQHFRTLPRHRKVQHTVTFGTLLQGAFTALSSDMTLWTLLAVLVGIAVSMIWVWAE